MSTFSYILDAALVLIVLLQIKERPLTNRSLLRPLVIVAVAVISYLHGIPTAGNDLVLVAVLGLFGLLLGTAAGQTTFVRRRSADGVVVARAGWLAGILWVLGMGLRFAFLIWINHSGASSLTHFSVAHDITSGEAWTVALLAMAVGEVAGRTVLLAARRHRVSPPTGPAAELA